MDVITGPYREDVLGGVCWEGVINFRRLVLVLCFTFINDKLLKQMALGLGCLAIVLIHVFCQPFRKRLSNAAETVSLCLLLIIAGSNLVKAVFFHTRTLPRGTSYLVMVVYEWVESTCVGILPLIIIVFSVFALLCKGVMAVTSKDKEVTQDSLVTISATFRPHRHTLQSIRWHNTFQWLRTNSKESKRRKIKRSTSRSDLIHVHSQLVETELSGSST